MPTSSTSARFSRGIRPSTGQGDCATTGLDWNSKNNEFASKVRKVLIGPTLKFNVPNGYFDVGLLYYKEKNKQRDRRQVGGFRFDLSNRAGLGRAFSARPRALVLRGVP